MARIIFKWQIFGIKCYLRHSEHIIRDYIFFYQILEDIIDIWEKGQQVLGIQSPLSYVIPSNFMKVSPSDFPVKVIHVA